jgi:hypothetical protein
VVESIAIGYGFPNHKIVSIGWSSSEKVFEKVLALTDRESLTVAIGNMGGMGADTVEYFENRSLK